MKFYIKQCNESTITLMTEAGYVLAYFSSVYEALVACEEWYFANAKEYKYEVMIDNKSRTIENQALYAA
jgi:hypothetical protein